MNIGTPAEILTAIGTLALAFATYLSVRETQRQTKRDRITKEIDLLIGPLMTVYKEIKSLGIDSSWWFVLYACPMSQLYEPEVIKKAENFRDAIENIEHYKYLCPENLRKIIDQFLIRLNEVRRNPNAGSKESQRLLKDETNKLYGLLDMGNGLFVEGGLVINRSYELTNEINLLDKGMRDRIRTLILDTRRRIYDRINPPRLFLGSK